MVSNLPPSITVNKNLASTLKAYIKDNGGKNVSEAQVNEILQRVAKFDAERDNGTREGGSIFDGGSKYFGGGANDFKVQQGQQIQFSIAEFNEIFKGFLEPMMDKSAANSEKTAPKALPKPDAPKFVAPEMTMPTTTPIKQNPVSAENTVEQLDGKIIEREVNGQKQKISVVEINGEKVRRAVNEDGTLGDTLVPISTAGKNKYITQTEMNNRIAQVFPDGLPEGVKASFTNIAGTPSLIFKKDGQTLDSAQLKLLAQEAKDAKAQQEIATNPQLVENETVSDTKLAENFAEQMLTTNQADISDVQALAKSQISLVNNQFGDGKDGVTADEYFNYERSGLEKVVGGPLMDMEATMLRRITDDNFGVIDGDGDGQITEQEFADYINNANANGDKTLTSDEVTDYLLAETNDVSNGGGEPLLESFAGITHVTGPSAEENPEYDQTIRNGYQGVNPREVSLESVENVAPTETPTAPTETPTVPQDDQPKVEPRRVEMRGVAGTYSITGSEDGKSFSVNSRMYASSGHPAQSFFDASFVGKNKMTRTDDGSYTFRGMKSQSANVLRNLAMERGRTISVNTAIYRDLMTKKDGGTELTKPEQQFVESYLNSLEQYQLGIDDEYNLVDKMKH